MTEAFVLIAAFATLVIASLFYDQLRDIRKATERTARLLEQQGQAQGWLRRP